MSEIRQDMITSRLYVLSTMLGKARRPANLEILRTSYEKQGLPTMIGHMMDHLSLPFRLSVGTVARDDQGPKYAAAWILMPEQFPLYGSLAHRNFHAKLFIRESFLRVASFEVVVVCVAHELSHLVLGGINTPLRSDEEAVDLAAMFLGYSEVSVAARETKRAEFTKENIFTALYYSMKNPLVQYGYLNDKEVVYADRLIRQHYR